MTGHQPAERAWGDGGALQTGLPGASAPGHHPGLAVSLLVIQKKSFPPVGYWPSFAIIIVPWSTSCTIENNGCHCVPNSPPSHLTPEADNSSQLYNRSPDMFGNSSSRADFSARMVLQPSAVSARRHGNFRAHCLQTPHLDRLPSPEPGSGTGAMPSKHAGTSSCMHATGQFTRAAGNRQPPGATPSP